VQQHRLNHQMGIKNPKIIISFLNFDSENVTAGNLYVLPFSSMDIRQYLLVILTAEIGKLEMM
jgi:hypothetical protein